VLKKMLIALEGLCCVAGDVNPGAGQNRRSSPEGTTLTGVLRFDAALIGLLYLFVWLFTGG
jgi:hypothetical protein